MSLPNQSFNLSKIYCNTLIELLEVTLGHNLKKIEKIAFGPGIQQSLVVSEKDRRAGRAHIKNQTLVTWTVTQLTGKALDQIHGWKVFSVNMDYVCTTNAMYYIFCHATFQPSVHGFDVNLIFHNQTLVYKHFHEKIFEKKQQSLISDNCLKK